MGLIDTDEAVEHFRRVIEATTNNNDAYNEGFIDALEFCIATLSTMPAAEQWIPVSERLPEEHEKVVFAVKSQNGQLRYRSGFYFKGTSCNVFCFDNGDVWALCENAIQAWMPAPKYPEPYKGDKHE